MLCPKCHRPLEGDEEYICCADAALQWRCTQCAKVSEGFAFPYGACPHCGGKLQVLNAVPVEDPGALAVLRTAFEIEVSGRAFYQQAAAETTDPLMRDVFERLAEMEKGHMETLARRYHVPVPEAPEQFKPEVAAVYAGIEIQTDDPAALLRVAIAFEDRAALFFAAQAEKAPKDSAERQAYLEMAAEERDHAQLLRTEFTRWRTGKPGML